MELGYTISHCVPGGMVGYDRKSQDSQSQLETRRVARRRQEFHNQYACACAVGWLCASARADVHAYGHSQRENLYAVE